MTISDRLSVMVIPIFTLIYCTYIYLINYLFTDGDFVTTEKSILDQSKEKIKQVAIKTGVKPWHVVAAIIFLICLVLGLCGWCTWRFLRKKR